MRLSVQCLGCFSSSVSGKPRDALIWLELDELRSHLFLLDSISKLALASQANNAISLITSKTNR